MSLHKLEPRTRRQDDKELLLVLSPPNLFCFAEQKSYRACGIWFSWALMLKCLASCAVLLQSQGFALTT